MLVNILYALPAELKLHRLPHVYGGGAYMGSTRAQALPMLANATMSLANVSLLFSNHHAHVTPDRLFGSLCWRLQHDAIMQQCPSLTPKSRPTTGMRLQALELIKITVSDAPAAYAIHGACIVQQAPHRVRKSHEEECMRRARGMLAMHCPAGAHLHSALLHAALG